MIKIHRIIFIAIIVLFISCVKKNNSNTVGVGDPGKATFWDAPSTPVALGGGWAACNLS